jgi:hypothetical protein
VLCCALRGIRKQYEQQNNSARLRGKLSMQCVTAKLSVRTLSSAVQALRLNSR